MEEEKAAGRRKRNEKKSPRPHRRYGVLGLIFEFW
jgi:hypothetical protein